MVSLKSGDRVGLYTLITALRKDLSGYDVFCLYTFSRLLRPVNVSLHVGSLDRLPATISAASKSVSFDDIFELEILTLQGLRTVSFYSENAVNFLSL